MNIKRLMALVTKERKQLLREPASIAIGIVLPVLMLLIFGYGMNMDVKNIRLDIVTHESSEIGTEIITRYESSDYFKVRVVHSTVEATDDIQKHHADAVLFLPSDLQRRFDTNDLTVMIGLNATNASVARLYENYIRQVFISSVQSRMVVPRFAGVQMTSRMWFNDTNESAYYMIPGVIVIIMAMIGCMLTSLQMAKEYEHGNMESMFVTPMSSAEILLAKMINNYLLGMLGLTIALIFARFLFDVPIRGSIAILLLGGSLFLLLQMALGLLISSITKSQFLASQISMIISFMPSFLLSGFLYEIPNMPTFLQYFTYIIPARYFVDFLQTIFLVGNVWSNIGFNIGMMTLFTVVLMLAAKAKNPKRLA